MKKIKKIAIVFSDTRKTDEALHRVTKIIESLNAEVLFLSSNVL